MAAGIAIPRLCHVQDPIEFLLPGCLGAGLRGHTRGRGAKAGAGPRGGAGDQVGRLQPGRLTPLMVTGGNVSADEEGDGADALVDCPAPARTSVEPCRRLLCASLDPEIFLIVLVSSGGGGLTYGLKAVTSQK